MIELSTKLEQLRDIARAIEQDNVTTELKAGATQLVFGEGNEDAEIVFIGEAPGKHEDLTGKPFVGAAGRFLDEMLSSIDLNRSDIYITNIVKYRPPNNRDPLPAEKQAFLPYLESQLEVIQPKLIVTLGRHSLNCFLPELQIGDCHGQLMTYRNRALLPLFHPAAALYNGGKRQILLQDFAKIPAILEKIN